MTRIGIITPGGDCPGINAAIRVAVLKGVKLGFEMVGYREGWHGLINKDFQKLAVQDVDEIISVSGTMLGTVRFDPVRRGFPSYGTSNGVDSQKYQSDWELILKGAKEADVSCFIVLGGDETMTMAHELQKEGVNVVGIPKTMDNDVEGTDYSIGFDTAVTTAVQALENLRQTAKSLRRVIVLEVMGRDTGWVALFTGLASGADWILLPEVENNLDEMCEHLKRVRERGKRYALVVVAEGVEFPGIKNRHPRRAAEYVAEQIEQKICWETRSSVIGHIQRGGEPTVFDRMLATQFGVKAVELAAEKSFGKMVCLKGSEISALSLAEAAGKTKKIPKKWYEWAETLLK